MVYLEHKCLFWAGSPGGSGSIGWAQHRLIVASTICPCVVPTTLGQETQHAHGVQGRWASPTAHPWASTAPGVP